VKVTGGELVARLGPEGLARLAKVHFKTAHQISPEHFEYVEKPFFRRTKKSG
jgi:hypothetical protein